MRLFNIFAQNPPDSHLEERVESLERGLKGLRLEWEETYDRISRLMSRIAKRAAVAQAKEAEDDPGDANGEEPVLDPLSQKIMALRRARRLG
jgi:hypothetical protein